MAPARTVGRAFSPLDEQLGLDAAGVTPRGQEALVRLATWMSFEYACELLSDLLGIQVSATSSRRLTYQAGQAALAVQPHLNPARRGRRFARYSWRQPFLRRPPACQNVPAKI